MDAEINNANGIHNPRRNRAPVKSSMLFTVGKRNPETIKPYMFYPHMMQSCTI